MALVYPTLIGNHSLKPWSVSNSSSWKYIIYTVYIIYIHTYIYIYITLSHTIAIVPSFPRLLGTSVTVQPSAFVFSSPCFGGLCRAALSARSCSTRKVFGTWGVLSHGGTPIARWITMKIHKKKGISWGYPYFRKPPNGKGPSWSGNNIATNHMNQEKYIGKWEIQLIMFQTSLVEFKRKSTVNGKPFGPSQKQPIAEWV